MKDKHQLVFVQVNFKDKMLKELIITESVHPETFILSSNVLVISQGRDQFRQHEPLEGIQLGITSIKKPESILGSESWSAWISGQESLTLFEKGSRTTYET